MNGVHDMGGMDGFGPVEIEKDEPIFHAEWERRAMALTVAMGFQGLWNIDKFYRTTGGGTAKAPISGPSCRDFY